jgi:hypothetical protein
MMYEAPGSASQFQKHAAELSPSSPDDVSLTQPTPSTSHISNKDKRARVEDVSDDEYLDNEGRENAQMNSKLKGEKNIN